MAEPQRPAVADRADGAGVDEARDRGLDRIVHLARRDDLVADEPPSRTGGGRSWRKAARAICASTKRGRRRLARPRITATGPSFPY